MSKKVFIILSLGLLLFSTFLAFWELDNVDLEASEDIYVSDSVGYLRGDPYAVPRHHLRKPHEPASPHPFFAPFLTYLVFKYFGLSLFNARLVQALSLVVNTVVVMLIARRLFNSFSVSLASGLVFITLPITVRFSRMAVLDPVLALIQGLGMLWALSIAKAKGISIYIFSGLVGLSLGLSISTKLTGVFFILPLAIFFVWQIIKNHDLRGVLSLSVFCLSGVAIFILFNDPYSYIYGWTHFSDPKHQNISFTAIVKGFFEIRYWYYFFTSLLGVIPLLLLTYALVAYRKWWQNARRLFIVSWLVGPASYLILNPIHITGLSAEWSYLPMVLPLSLVMGKSLVQISSKLSKKFPSVTTVTVYVLYLILALPMLLNYGLRFKPLPLASYRRARNVIRGDLAVTKTVNILNQDKNSVSVLIDLKSVGFPLWLLNDNISTEPFYHEISFYDYIVTDNPNLISLAQENNFLIKSREKNPTELEIFLFEKAKN